MKNMWDGINSRLDIAEEKFSELKDSDCKLYKMKYTEKKRKKMDSASVSFKWSEIYVLMESKTRQERKKKKKAI